MDDRHQEMRGGRLMQLTEDAQFYFDDWQDMKRNRGCSCHISAPCSLCHHEGNPLSLENDDAAWEPVEETAADRDSAGIQLTEPFILPEWITPIDFRGAVLLEACEVVEQQMKPDGRKW